MEASDENAEASAPKRIKRGAASPAASACSTWTDSDIGAYIAACAHMAAVKRGLARMALFMQP